MLAMVSFWLNGEKMQTEEDTHLIGLTRHLKLPESGIAIAINEEIIPKARWEKQFIKAADKVLIITASQGG